LAASMVTVHVLPIAVAHAPAPQPAKPELAPALAVRVTVLLVNVWLQVPGVQGMPVGVDVTVPLAPGADSVASSVALPVPVRLSVSVPPLVACTVRVAPSLGWPPAPPAMVGA